MIRHSLSREQHVFSFGELQIIHSSSQPKCRLEAKAQFSHKWINRILTGFFFYQNQPYRTKSLRFSACVTLPAIEVCTCSKAAAAQQHQLYP